MLFLLSLFFSVIVAQVCNNQENSVLCDGSSLIFCKSNSIAASRLCDLGCEEHAKVPARCKTRSKVFPFQTGQGQQLFRWQWFPSELKRRLTDDEFQSIVRDSTNTTVYIQSVSMENDDGSGDVQFRNPYQLDTLPNTANIHGVQVHVLMRSHQHAHPGPDEVPSIATVDGNVYCFPKDMEFTLDDDDDSDNHGAYGRGKPVAAPSSWTKPTVFGSPLDNWLLFTRGSDFKRKLLLEMDFRAATFDATAQVRTRTDLPSNDVSCFISWVAMEVFYSEPPLLPPSALRLLVQGGKRGALWDYFAALRAPGADAAGKAWYQPGYTTDANWKQGRAVIGYKSDEETTVSRQVQTLYVRHEFEVQEEVKACFDDLRLRYTLDDGAIVYLNGQPLWWHNVELEATGWPWAYSDRANASAINEDDEKETVLPGNLLLLKGTNVLAAQIHQVSASSSDLAFDLTLFVFSKCGRPTQQAGETTPVYGTTPAYATTAAPTDRLRTTAAAPPPPAACTSDSDCKGDIDGGKCVGGACGCTYDTDCAVENSVCAFKVGRCVKFFVSGNACSADENCPKDKPVCNLETKMCVACKSHEDCSSALVCPGHCSAAGECERPATVTSCPAGAVCVRSAQSGKFTCTGAQPTGAPRACQTDKDCPRNNRCHESLCVDKHTLGEPEPAPSSSLVVPIIVGVVVVLLLIGIAVGVCMWKRKRPAYRRF